MAQNSTIENYEVNDDLDLEPSEETSKPRNLKVDVPSLPISNLEESSSESSESDSEGHNGKFVQPETNKEPEEDSSDNLSEDHSSEQQDGKNPIDSSMGKGISFTGVPEVRMEEMDRAEVETTEAGRKWLRNKDAMIKRNSIVLEKDQVSSVLEVFFERRPSQQEIARKMIQGFQHALQKDDRSSPTKEKPSKKDSSSEDEGEEDSDDSSWNTDKEELERERAKAAKANETIATLLNQVTQYKLVLEEEKTVLENELKEQKNKFKTAQAQWNELREKLEKQLISLDQEVELYQDKVDFLEEEKIKKSKETIEDLQTLVKELNYIEETNDHLNKQIAAEKEVQESFRIQLETSKELIHTLSAKVAALEAENKSLANNAIQQDKILTFSISENLPSRENRTPEESANIELGLLQEISALKQQLQLTSQELQMHKAKLRNVASLASQIKSAVGFSEEETKETDQTLLNNYKETLEMYERAQSQLDEERKKVESDREYINNQSQRIRDLMKLQQSYLKQLDAERERVKEERELNKKLTEEIKTMKATKTPKKLVLLDTPDSDTLELVEEVEGNKNNEIHSDNPERDFVSGDPRLSTPQMMIMRSRRRAQSEVDLFSPLQRRQSMSENVGGPVDSGGSKIRELLRKYIHVPTDGTTLLPPGWQHRVDSDGKIQYINPSSGQTSSVHPLFKNGEKENGDAPSKEATTPEEGSPNDGRTKHRKDSKKEKKPRALKKGDMSKSFIIPKTPKEEVKQRSRANSMDERESEKVRTVLHHLTGSKRSLKESMTRVHAEIKSRALRKSASNLHDKLEDEAKYSDGHDSDRGNRKERTSSPLVSRKYLSESAHNSGGSGKEEKNKPKREKKVKKEKDKEKRRSKQLTPRSMKKELEKEAQKETQKEREASGS